MYCIPSPSWDFFFLPGYIRILFLFTPFRDTPAMLCDTELAGNRDFQDDASGVKACFLVISTYQKSLVHFLEPSRKNFLPSPEWHLLFKNNAFPSSLYRHYNCFWVIWNSNHVDFKVRQAGIESQFGFCVAGTVQSINLPLIVFRTGITTRKRLLRGGNTGNLALRKTRWSFVEFNRVNQILIPLRAF